MELIHTGTFGPEVETALRPISGLFDDDRWLWWGSSQPLKVRAIHTVSQKSMGSSLNQDRGIVLDYVEFFDEGAEAI